jgi:hypothetical protein
MLKPIAIATAIAGTLDILAAIISTLIPGKSPIHMLQSVASGPLGPAALTSPGYAAAGLLVHFAIMACMVTVYMVAARQLRPLLDRPILAGTVYGVALWLVMYWVVLPLRFSAPHPSQPFAIAQQLFCHIILVGIPIGLVAARYLRPPGPAQ